MLTIIPFKGDPNDNQLEGIGMFLKEISEIADVRPIMKRFYEHQTHARNFDHRIQTVKKQLGPKFMVSLNSPRLFCDTNRESMLGSHKEPFEDTDENTEGEEVRHKLKSINQQQDKKNLTALITPRTLKKFTFFIKEPRDIRIEETNCLFNTPLTYR